MRNRGKLLMKCFILEIKILEDAWHYKDGQIILYPNFAKTLKNALTRFDNEHCGSEYPYYEVLKNTECDSDGLFNPLKTCKLGDR